MWLLKKYPSRRKHTLKNLGVKGHLTSFQKVQGKKYRYREIKREYEKYKTNLWVNERSLYNFSPFLYA